MGEMTNLMEETALVDGGTADPVADVSDSPIPEVTQKALLSHLTTELDVAKRNNEKVNDDFKVFYNMIHSIRNGKPNDWESDISLPEFLSRLLAQIGNFCTQMFSSTDYVEVDLDSDDPMDIMESKAAKKLLNVLLKEPDAYFYHKIVRLINIVFIMGCGIIKGGYQQKVNNVFSHNLQRSEPATHPTLGGYMATDGTPYVDPITQQPAFNTMQEPQYKDEIEVDKPIFDVFPNQNVYQSPEYAYSLNDKEYVIFENPDKKLSDLEAEAEYMGYFNLDKLRDTEPEGQRGEKTYNTYGTIKEQPEPPEKVFCLFERWGKYPVRDENGVFVPAIDDKGKFEKGAKLEECIIHYVQDREKDEPRHIIGFRKSNHSRRPMVKFLCYVDMVNDNGFGDGEVNRELQIAIDDNFNIGAFRTQLAAQPSFKGKKFMVPDKIKVGPNHVTMLENLGDLEQWVIQDNPQGTGYQHGLLASRMDYAMATSPQTMGMPSDRAETATVGAITNQRANIRIGMKSMNLEFIGFDDFYRMLLTLCNDFMLPETLETLIGPELAMAYNPKRKDKFKPVSQALQTEESKQFNVKALQSVLGMIAPIQNPKTPMMVNMLVGEILEAMGKKFKLYKKFMLDDSPESVAMYQAITGAKMSVQQSPQMNPMNPAQNQNGLPQQQIEQQTRGAANG